MTDSDFPGINQIWADLLVEELIRLGVGLFCLAPGSRSAPLALAVAAHPRAKYVMHYDERGAAFCALGYGRATRRPAAWITTSGTAVANGMPAVAEASMDCIPMLLVTADRPPELRAAGANQTLDQVKIFGEYVRWQCDLPAPDPAINPAFVLTTADQAAYRAARMPAGPVHLNAMYREPLVSDPDKSRYADYLDGLQAWRDSDAPYTCYGLTPNSAKTPVSGSESVPDSAKTPVSGPESAPGSAKTPVSGRESAEEIPKPSVSGFGAAHNISEILITYSFAAPRFESLMHRLLRAKRGLIVAGRLADRTQADAVRRLAQKLGWPLLPDVCSQLRFSEKYDVSGSTDKITKEGAVASQYDLALASEAFRAAHAPDAVVHFGGAAVSKRLNAWLSDVRPALFAVVREAPDRMDPGHCVTDYIESGIAFFCRSMLHFLNAAPEADERRIEAGWAGSWVAVSDAVSNLLNEKMSEDLSEPAVARFLSRRTPDDATLMLGSSMPIRDMDMYGDASGRAPFVAANRGASGIDGAVATAAGLAYGRGAPVVLATGDLGLLHDLNSLPLAASAPAPVLIVAINNSGGGIFSLLPVARCGDAFEPLFGTPHRWRFEQAARMFDLGYAAARDLRDLSEAYDSALSSGKSHIIEVATDRAENAQLHRRLETLVCEHVSDMVRTRQTFTNPPDS